LTLSAPRPREQRRWVFKLRVTEICNWRKTEIGYRSNARRDFYHAPVVFRKFKCSDNLLNLYDQFRRIKAGREGRFR